MKIFIILALVICSLSLSGCVYSSSNLARAQGKDILWIGGEGIVHVQDASLVFYRSMDARSHKNEAPDFATKPNILENSSASNFSIGEAKSVKQPISTWSSTLPIIPTANNLVSK